MIPRFLHLFVAFALLILSGVADAEDPAAGLRELDGSIADWHSYLRQDKWLLVKVWDANCVVCNATVHEIVALDRQRGGQDLIILGIALHQSGDTRAIDDYITRHGVTFHNLLDDGSNVAFIYRDATGAKWGGWTPTFLLFDPQGKVAAKNIGPVRARDVTAFIDRRNK